MNNRNNIQLIGYLATDTELRSTGNGVSVCNFRIGVKRKYKDSDGNHITDWFNIIAWRKLGELCSQYLMKGAKISILGELQTRSYEDKEGNKRTVYEIIANDVEFLTQNTNNNNEFISISNDPLPF